MRENKESIGQSQNTNTELKNRSVVFTLGQFTRLNYANSTLFNKISVGASQTNLLCTESTISSYVHNESSNKSSSKKQWSPADDLRIIQLQQTLGRNWHEMAARTGHRADFIKKRSLFINSLNKLNRRRFNAKKTDQFIVMSSSEGSIESEKPQKAIELQKLPLAEKKELISELQKRLCKINSNILDFRNQIFNITKLLSS